jgi:lipoprotein-anchoring transpeptidase ErfK/SrfK
VFEAQLALGRLGISSGSIDGRIGPQTRSALRAFQQKEHLAVTGELDAATQERLLLAASPYAVYTVTAEDLARLQPLSRTWLGKSQQTALDYETILELVAEKGHSHPNLIRQLNPSIDWTNVATGTTVQLPDVAYADASPKAAFATISLAGRVLEAFDANTNLLAHFPCSIAQHVEKRPVGELHVAKIAPNPNYTFDPDVFPESAEARQLKRKLVLPPGPNNPVGVAWISLDKPGRNPTAVSAWRTGTRSIWSSWSGSGCRCMWSREDWESEGRIPKSEGNPKTESRNPKRGSRPNGQKGPRHSSATDFAPDIAAPEDQGGVPADFGLRPSFGFRYSVFGFGTPHTPH